MKTTKQQLNTLLTFALVLASSHASALQLETGKWEISTQSSNPMTGQPLNETTTECIEDSQFDPTVDLVDDESCTVTDKQESDDSVSWKMQCGGSDGMPVFSGEGTFTSNGTSAEGDMTMVMSMGGQTMEMSNHWSGNRISSECD